MRMEFRFTLNYIKPKEKRVRKAAAGRLFCTMRKENRMEPIRLTLQSGACTEIDSPHEGEEFGYVLSGRILLHLGDECHKVKKGESFYYPASCNHYLENPGKTPAIILWVSSPPYF